MSNHQADETFNVIMSGKVLEGFALAQVKETVRSLFKLQQAQVEKLLAGKPTAVQRGVRKEQALKLRVALAKAGAGAQIKAATPAVVDNKAAEAISNKAGNDEGQGVVVRAATAAIKGDSELSCPRCGHQQPKARSCGRCKMDLTLHSQRVAKKAAQRAWRQQHQGAH